MYKLINIIIQKENKDYYIKKKKKKMNKSRKYKNKLKNIKKK